MSLSLECSLWSGNYCYHIILRAGFTSTPFYYRNCTIEQLHYVDRQHNWNERLESANTTYWSILDNHRIHSLAELKCSAIILKWQSSLEGKYESFETKAVYFNRIAVTKELRRQPKEAYPEIIIDMLSKHEVF